MPKRAAWAKIILERASMNDEWVHWLILFEHKIVLEFFFYARPLFLRNSPCAAKFGVM